MVKRNEIWIVKLDPVVGHEISKIRPAVIVQNDVGNKYSSMTIVAPLTSRNLDNIYPVDVHLPKTESHLPTDSKILCGQIRSLDKSRLIRRVGKISDAKVFQMNNALMRSLGLTRF